MIGVDTNVLVRLLVQDPPSQHQSSLRFFGQRSKDDPAYVSLIVVVEFIWVMRTVYDYSMDSIRLALTSLLDSPDIHMQGRELVADAIVRSAQPKVDLVDVLIVGLAALQGCTTTVTFDKTAAKRVPGMELLA